MEYFAHGGNNGGYNMMSGWDGHAGYGPWGWLFMLVMMVLVVIGIVWVVKSLTRNSSAPKSDDPLDIFKSRYAKGEINKQQFEEIKKDIRSK